MIRPGFALIALCGTLAIRTAMAEPPADYAQLPHWPIGLRLPDPMVVRKPSKTPPRADVLVWIPPSAGGIRAVMLVPENTDSRHFAEHGPFREMAARHGLAVVYFRGVFDTGIEKPDGPSDPTRIQGLLDHLAATTGAQDLRHAPWVTFGKSSRGKFPFRLAWLYPERTIASVTYHGETPTWPPGPEARLEASSVLQVNVNGQTEWAGTWFRHVRPTLLNYRAHSTWLCHQVVVPGVGHGDYIDAHGSPGWGQPFPGKATCVAVWDYLTLFLDRALELRLPPGPLTPGETLRLRAVDTSQGWLIDPFAVEAALGLEPLPLERQTDGTFRVAGGEAAPDLAAAMRPAPPGTSPAPASSAIRPAAEVADAARPTMFWVPDRDVAEAWLRLHAAQPGGRESGLKAAE